MHTPRQRWVVLLSSAALGACLVLLTGSVRPVRAQETGAVSETSAAPEAGPAQESAATRIEADGYRTEFILGAGARPYDLTGDGQGQIWFTDIANRQVGRLDPRTGVVATFPAPDGTNPFLIASGPDGSLWVTDNDFVAAPGPRQLIRLDPVSLAGDLFRVPRVNAGPFAVAARDGQVWFTGWQGHMLGRLDLEPTPQFQEFTPPDGERPGGPMGLAFDRDGSLWYMDSYNERFVRLDPRSGDQAAFRLPVRFAGPVAVAIDRAGRLWTGEHGGDRLIALDPATGTFELFVTPSPPEAVYPVSGLNDLDFDSRGDVWFTEHFINRFGRLHRETGTVLEYTVAREQPAMQWLWVDDDDGVWYAEYGTGTIVRVDARRAPLVTLATEQPSIRLRPGESAAVSLTATYVSGPAESLPLQAFGQGNWLVEVAPAGSDANLARGESARFQVRVRVSDGDRTETGTYLLPVGVQAPGFTATRGLKIEVVGQGAPVEPAVTAGAPRSVGRWVPAALLVAAGALLLAHLWRRRRAR